MGWLSVCPWCFVPPWWLDGTVVVDVMSLWASEDLLFVRKLLSCDPVAWGSVPPLLPTCLVVYLQALTPFNPRSSHHTAACGVLTTCTEGSVGLFVLL